MLAQIASIYIHLGRADGQAIFARAIAHDERSFRQEMFAESSKVFCFFGFVMGHQSLLQLPTVSIAMRSMP